MTSSNRPEPFARLALCMFLPVLLAAAPVSVMGCSDGPCPAALEWELLAVKPSSAGSYDWLQFNGDAAHSGNNTAEALVSAENVGTLRPLFQVALPATADGAPVVLSGVTTTLGVRDLVFVSTSAGNLLALDAVTGATIWSIQNGPGTCKINNGSSTCYTTSSPAIDPSRQFVYSYGLEGRVHKYAVGTGTEVTTGGWPELVTSKPFDEKESPPLVFATDPLGTTYLYVANGGYPGDNGDYQGHITTINLSDGSQKVFNSLCSDETVHFVETPGTPDCIAVQGAVWARSAVVYDQATGRIYAATGNADFNPGKKYWGDTVFALNPDGTGLNGSPLDSWTPANFQSLQDGDLDLGSTAPAILPGSAKVPHLAAQGGKDGLIRLLNLDNLSNQGSGAGPGRTGGEISTIPVPQGGQVLSAPAVWVNPTDGSTWMFISTSNGISGLSLTEDSGGNPSLAARWKDSAGGFSPLVANGVLYYAGSGHLRALEPTTGAVLFDGTTIGGIHWESPVVANGIVYITDGNSRLSAFSLPPGSADFSLSAAPSVVTVGQGSSGTSTITITQVGGFTGTVALSASGLPSGVTARFDPASTPRATTLTLVASSTAAVGTSDVTVTGTSGGLTHTTSLGLAVTNGSARPTSGGGCETTSSAPLVALAALFLLALRRRKSPTA